MSLKAKLEAVIYAAEEPVTLAQLALLFTADALEWKAEQDAADAATRQVEAREAAAAAGTQESLLPDGENPNPEGTVTILDADAESGPGEEQVVEAAVESTLDETHAEPAADAAADVVRSETETVPGSGAAAPPEAGETGAEGEAQAAVPDGESDLKREARQRDRDVRNVLRGLLDELIAQYATDDRGIEIREVAGGYRMATKPECHDAVRGFVKGLKPPLKLSLPALETLAVIAYKQPVTAPEVNEIRGVDSSGVFGSLLSRKLIATAGRKQVLGRPILYKTTREFLLRFGLKDVSELPSMEEFEKLAASELEEPATAEGEESAAPVGMSPELDETASEEAATESAASNPTEPAAQESGQQDSAVPSVAEADNTAGETATPEAAAKEIVADEAESPAPAEIEHTPHD